MTVKYPEHIYAIQSTGLNKVLSLNDGYTTAIPKADFFAAIQAHVVLAQRNMLEQNPDYRQFLPYMLISRIAGGVKQYLVYLRAKGAGEARLCGNASIGVGGHVDANDTVLSNNNVLHFNHVIEQAHTRELFEELRYGPPLSTEDTHVSMMDMDPAEGIRLASYISSKTRVHGYITELEPVGADGKVPVGLVHMAYVMEIELGEVVNASCNESAMEMVGWMTADQLAISTLTFENWSKILIEQLPSIETTIWPEETFDPSELLVSEVVEAV
jgi:predicted NUDIX family phosphoesterase